MSRQCAQFMRQKKIRVVLCPFPYRHVKYEPSDRVVGAGFNPPCLREDKGENGKKRSLVGRVTYCYRIFVGNYYEWTRGHFRRNTSFCHLSRYIDAQNNRVRNSRKTVCTKTGVLTGHTGRTKRISVPFTAYKNDGRRSEGRDRYYCNMKTSFFSGNGLTSRPIFTTPPRFVSLAQICICYEIYMKNVWCA